MYNNKIRLPLLLVLATLMILDLTGVIHVPLFVILLIALALIWYNIHIRKNIHKRNKSKT
ncbi:hypothetical protein SH601_15910 [Gracilibacillus sp. S3-1-1]|uniref:Uncharacterized protein n=1 Tax=Gracilibacillus pellucidus TaxID=3095368 RepID=A0ACC6M981_9BACI|nr:hypothetical protein [Gracilibacillus sp. S3-1-1]MDX8047453.1 hypothetical protein [Gracilibacillus sp. S3-1-1]